VEEKKVAMSNRKVIAVVGATGAQGGGLVRAILNDPNRSFAARVLRVWDRAAGSRCCPALAFWSRVIANVALRSVGRLLSDICAITVATTSDTR